MDHNRACIYNVISACSCLTMCDYALFILCNYFQIWDMGKGFKIPEIYRSGYLVIAMSVLTSLALTAV